MPPKTKRRKVESKENTLEITQINLLQECSVEASVSPTNSIDNLLKDREIL